jgi:hypothetical protein
LQWRAVRGALSEKEAILLQLWLHGNLRRLAKDTEEVGVLAAFRAEFFLLRETPMMALICITVPPFGRMHLASLPGEKQPPAYSWQFENYPVRSIINVAFGLWFPMLQQL